MKKIFFLSSSVNSELLDVINSQSLYRCDRSFGSKNVWSQLTPPQKIFLKVCWCSDILNSHFVSNFQNTPPAILWFAFFCSTTIYESKMWLRGCAASFCVPSKEDSLEELRTCDKLWYSWPFIFNCVLLNQQYWCKEWLTSWSPVRSVLILGPDSDNELPKMHLHRIELKQEKYYLKHKKSRGPPGPDTFDWRWLRASGLWQWTRLTHVKVTTATSLSTSYSDHLTHLYIRWVH